MDSLARVAPGRDVAERANDQTKGGDAERSMIGLIETREGPVTPGRGHRTARLIFPPVQSRGDRAHTELLTSRRFCTARFAK
jgi:hypothetical protein